MSALEPGPLAPLLAPLTALRGIGAERAALIGRACGGERVLDALFHLPENYVDRRARPTVRGARVGQVATFDLEIVRQDRPERLRQPWRILAKDNTGFIELVFFRPAGLERLAPGSRVVVSGKVESFNGRAVINHPDHILPEAQAGRLPAIEPVWKLVGGVTNRMLGFVVAQALERLPELPEWHDPALLTREGWPGFAESLRALQAPAAWPEEPARLRLAYDELLAHQVAWAVIKGRARARPGRALLGDGALRAQALARFGHAPTASQAAALAEIDADLAAPRRMLRLLQGDVGSGKTLVALLAMLRAVEAGGQAALMAPTELLARQHHRTLSRLAPVPVALLTGSTPAGARARTLRGLADGDIPIVVGTHALFQDSVVYRDLALAVIDEQHRFGVDQRVLMGAKGERTDVLVMTATPIPRTLLLTDWGELDVTLLTGKPAGRLPIRTTTHALSALPDVLDAVARAMDGGAQVYWVCPLVEESEALDLAAATDRCTALRERFGETVQLAHGRQEASAREAALADFAAGRARLLVATTVIEVGVDVPQASVMVIEHAERFGLAQLHQLRGRVGRGAAASFCLLLHDDALTESARRRLRMLRETEDGFRIADEDFRIRGGGDLLGRRQSGAPGWKIADPLAHGRLLRIAHRDAALLLEKDPTLASPRGRAVRLLLRLFDRQPAMRTLLAG
jgi:ATP-dependent DNA helicase RecG